MNLLPPTHNYQLSNTDPYDWSQSRQPKKDIGEYVRANSDIKVPVRYESLEQALNTMQKGSPVIMRSEHPQEYDQFSGLLDSYVLDKEHPPRGNPFLADILRCSGTSEEILMSAKLDGPTKRALRRYLTLTRQTDTFYDDVSFSFWEHIPGRNIAVVADDAVEGRYHLTSHGSGGRGGPRGGIFNVRGRPFNESDAIADSLGQNMDHQTIKQLIKTYDQVRDLPRFSRQQCPIMEMQVDDNGEIWFLQYHRARTFRATTERLDPKDYPYQEGWQLAQTVRGAIGSFVTLKTALWHPEHYRPADRPEDASFDLHFDIGLSEYLAPTRTAGFSHMNAIDLYRNMADGRHELRSRWFKPAGALALGRSTYEQFISPAEKDALLDKIFRGEMSWLTIDAASDGLQGFIRRAQDATK